MRLGLATLLLALATTTLAQEAGTLDTLPADQNPLPVTDVAAGSPDAAATDGPGTAGALVTDVFNSIAVASTPVVTNVAAGQEESTVVPTPPASSPQESSVAPTTIASNAIATALASVPLPTLTTPITTTTTPTSSGSPSKALPTTRPGQSASGAKTTASDSEVSATSAAEAAIGGKKNTGAVVGGAIAAVLIIALAIAGFFLYRRRRSHASKRSPPTGGEYEALVTRNNTDAEAAFTAVPGTLATTGDGGMVTISRPPATRQLSMPLSLAASDDDSFSVPPPVVVSSDSPQGNMPIISRVSSAQALPQDVDLSHSRSFSGVEGVTLPGKSAASSAALADEKSAAMVAKMEEKENEKAAEAEAMRAQGHEPDPVPPYWLNAGTEEAHKDLHELGRAPTYKSLKGKERQQ